MTHDKTRPSWRILLFGAASLILCILAIGLHAEPAEYRTLLLVGGPLTLLSLGILGLLLPHAIRQSHERH